MQKGPAGNGSFPGSYNAHSSRFRKTYKQKGGKTHNKLFTPRDELVAPVVTLAAQFLATGNLSGVNASCAAG